MKIFYDCDEVKFKKFAKGFGVKHNVRFNKYIILWSWKSVLKWIVIILLAPLFIAVEIASSIMKLLSFCLDKAFGEVGEPIKIIRLVKKEEMI